MSDTMPVTTVLSCKNAMVREGLKHVLLNTRYKVQPEDPVRKGDGIAASFPSGAAPLLFILDANLHPNGIAEAIQDLKQRHPQARVVVLSDSFALEAMTDALSAGADGYCLATIGCDALIKYLDLAMLGEVVFPSALFLSAMSEIKVASEKAASAHGSHALQVLKSAEPIGLPVRNLSSREAEILHCLTQGAPNKVIARKLDVAEATVKVHIKAILRKIRVANRTQAAMWAVAHLPNQGMGDTLTPPRS